MNLCKSWPVAASSLPHPDFSALIAPLGPPGRLCFTSSSSPYPANAGDLPGPHSVQSSCCHLPVGKQYQEGGQTRVRVLDEKIEVKGLGGGAEVMGDAVVRGSWTAPVSLFSGRTTACHLKARTSGAHLWYKDHKGMKGINMGEKGKGDQSGQRGFYLD